MNKSFVIAAILSLVAIQSLAQNTTGTASSAEPVMVELRNVSIGHDGTKVNHLVEVVGCQPKSYFDDCWRKTTVKVNKTTIVASELLRYRIFSLYNRISFSDYTKGVFDNDGKSSSPFKCAMGGPGKGSFLSVYYRETAPDNIYEVTNRWMKAVYSESHNCIFEHEIYPKDPSARESAIRLFEVLQTLALRTKKGSI